MNAADYLLLLGIVAFASYAQAVTGFAFGLILMGSAILLNLAPVATMAILISLLSLCNCAVALYRNYRNLDRQLILPSLLASSVFLLLGYWILTVLSARDAYWLQIILGLAIVLSSLLLIFRPRPQVRRSRTSSFLFFGGIAGLMSGLFSTSGPPLVYQFYRQPIAQKVIRDSLLLIFAITSIQRLTVVAVTGELTRALLLLAFSALPPVLVFTWLGRRWPPPVSDHTLRRFAFSLLLLAGVSLMLTA